MWSKNISNVILWFEILRMDLTFSQTKFLVGLK